MASSYKLSVDLVLKSIDVIGPEVHKALTILCRLTDPSKNLPFAKQNLPCADELPRETFPSHEFWDSYNFQRIGNTGMSFSYKDEPEEHTTYIHPNLNVRCNINWGHDAIHSFLDWILPYVESMPNVGRYDDEWHDADLVTVELRDNADGSKGWIFQFFEYEDWKNKTKAKLIKEEPLSGVWKNKAEREEDERRYAAMRTPKIEPSN